MNKNALTFTASEWLLTFHSSELSNCRPIRGAARRARTAVKASAKKVLMGVGASTKITIFILYPPVNYSGSQFKSGIYLIPFRIVG